MAFAAGTIWHNKTTGATDQGGGFNPTSANFATDGTVDTNTGNTASPVFSSASYNFAAGDVGHWLFIKTGTNSIPGWYQIASVASNKATLTAGIGSAVLYGTDATKRTYQRPNGLNTAAGIATVGTPTGLTWGVDYSQANSNRITFSDLVIDASNNLIFTSAANPVGKNFVGNILNVTSGTGFTVQRVQVVSTSGTQATVDKSLGTTGSTGGAGKLGGCVGTSANLTALERALVAGNLVYIWGGTYTLTTGVTLQAGVKGNGTDGLISVEGCSAYMGDEVRPTITSATSTLDLITLNDNDFFEWLHFNFTHTGATRGRALNCTSAVSSPVYCRDVVCDGCLNFIGSGTIGVIGSFTLEDVEIKNCTSHGIQQGNGSSFIFYRCDIYNNAGNGIRSSTAGNPTNTLIFTIIDNNGGDGIGHVQINGSTTLTLIHSVIAFNTGDGVDLVSTSGTTTLEIVNSIFYGNGVEGFDNNNALITTAASLKVMRNNGWGGQTPNYSNLYAGTGDVTLTANPFTDSGSRDYTLNNTAGGGADLKAAGVGMFDIGRWQTQESGGGGFLVNGGLVS